MSAGAPRPRPRAARRRGRVPAGAPRSRRGSRPASRGDSRRERGRSRLPGRARAARAGSSRSSRRGSPPRSRAPRGRAARSSPPGVTSRGPRPVPPVVSTTAARSASSVSASPIGAALVRHDAPLDLVAVGREQLVEQVAAAVLARPLGDAVGDGQHRRPHTRLLRLLEQPHVAHGHALVDRLGHVVDRQGRDRTRRSRPPSRPRSARSSPRSRRSRRRSSRPRASTSTCDSGSGWQSGISSARPLRRHDPGELRGRERVALRQLAQPRGGLGRHRHRRPRHGPPPRERLLADVDHPHGPRLVDVREVAHRRRYRLPRCTSPRRWRHAAEAFAPSPCP